MVYKRDKKETLDWNNFQKILAPRLIELGIPSSIVSSKFRWNYLLEHGNEFESGWCSSQLDESRANELLNLLKKEYMNNEAVDLMQKIKKSSILAKETIQVQNEDAMSER